MKIKSEAATGGVPLEVFYKKVLLTNFAIFTGKHLSWNLFLIKFKKRLQYSYFPVNIANFLGVPILKIECERLLL